MVKGIAGLAVLLMLAPPSASPAGKQLPLLMDARQVNELTAEQAKQEYPVLLHGVITYADVKLGHAFIQDSTAASFVYWNPTGTDPALEVGSKVSLRGPVCALYNDPRQTRGVKIFVPGPAYVAVLKAPPAHPYAAGEVPLRQIRQYDVTSDLEAPIRVRGTVAVKESGGLVYVSDGETSVAIQ